MSNLCIIVTIVVYLAAMLLASPTTTAPIFTWVAARWARWSRP